MFVTLASLPSSSLKEDFQGKIKTNISMQFYRNIFLNLSATVISDGVSQNSKDSVVHKMMSEMSVVCVTVTLLANRSVWPDYVLLYTYKHTGSGFPTALLIVWPEYGAFGLAPETLNTLLCVLYRRWALFITGAAPAVQLVSSNHHAQP